MKFKIGDEVKYHDNYSDFMWYGIISKLTTKHVYVKCTDGFIAKVLYQNVNFN